MLHQHVLVKQVRSPVACLARPNSQKQTDLASGGPVDGHALGLPETERLAGTRHDGALDDLARIHVDGGDLRVERLALLVRVAPQQVQVAAVGGVALEVLGLGRGQRLLEVGEGFGKVALGGGRQVKHGDVLALALEVVAHHESVVDRVDGARVLVGSLDRGELLDVLGRLG